MTDLVVFVLASLAAFRIWRLWALDALPPIVWVRDRVELGVADRFGDGWAAGVTCAHCVGFWISCVVVGGVWAVRPLTLPALWFGAVSAVVGLLASYDKG